LPKFDGRRGFDVADQDLLAELLESWERNNLILVNLLRAIPDGGLTARAIEGSPTLAQLFTPIHYVRLVFVYEDTPEFAKTLPEQEWPDQRDQDRIAQMLDKSAKALREAVKGRLKMGRWTFTTITRSCCCST
jgi:hypothetical protein